MCNTGRIHIPVPAKSAPVKDKRYIFHSQFSVYQLRPNGMYPNPWRPAGRTILLLAGYLTGVAADTSLQIGQDAVLIFHSPFVFHAFLTLQRNDLLPVAPQWGHSGKPGVKRLSAGPWA